MTNHCKNIMRYTLKSNLFAIILCNLRAHDISTELSAVQLTAVLRSV